MYIYISISEIFRTINERKTNQHCIDRLVTEVYKFPNVYLPDIINEICYLRQNTYNIQNSHAFDMLLIFLEIINNYLLNSSVFV